MGNIYGVANPVLLANRQLLIGGADIVLTAGGTIPVFTWTNIAAPSPGNYYPMVIASLAVQAGAALPASLTFNLTVNGGSTVQSAGINVNAIPVNGYNYVPVQLFGVESPTLWVAAGSTVTINGQAVTNPITAKFAGTRAILLLLRADDSMQ